MPTRGSVWRLEVDTSFASRRVTRVLEAIVAERGQPLAIRCDNGPELTSPRICSKFPRISATIKTAVVALAEKAFLFARLRGTITPPPTALATASPLR